MAKITLEDITSGYASIAALNSNNTAIETAIEKTLFRDGTGPNHMESDLDMNGHRIINQGNVIAISGFNWEGSWITSTPYDVGDVIEYNGSAYVCIEDHTSGTFAIDLAAIKWQLVAQASLPDQTGHNQHLLTTNGSTASWATTTGFIWTLLDDSSASEALSTLGVSSFAQTLLDDSNAAATRSTLGLAYGPAFSAYANVDQSISSGVNTKANLDVEEFDTAGCFSAGRFTPNVAGYYQINGSARLVATNLTVISVGLYKNGSPYKTAVNAGFPASATAWMGGVSSLVYLNGSTDYVELYVYAEGTTPIIRAFDSARTAWLNGYLARMP